MTDDLLGVLRVLVNAAFTTGGITDAELTDLLGKIDAAAAPPAPPADPAPAPPADVPAPDAEAGGDEGTGFGA